MKAQDDPRLPPRDAGRHIRRSPSTLANWRRAGVGPRYYQIGGRIEYSVADLDEWLAMCARQPSAVAA